MPAEEGKEVRLFLPMISIIVFPIILLDQLAKYIVSKALVLNQPIPVINNIFYLTLVHNRGAAFGILKNQAFFFILVSVFAIALISVNIKNYARLSGYSVALNLILAGTIGNLIDRLMFGYVRDFLDFRIWPVFNIADSAITCGAVLLGYSILMEARRSKP